MSGGLSSAEAARRLAEQGPNEIRREAAVPWWRLLLAQLRSPMVALLAAAGVLSLAVGDALDAAAIGAIVVLNAAVGFFQEYRAERALLALRSLTAPRARVLRDGASSIVQASEVVVGDVLVLEAGDVVAADGRLLEAHSLATVEAQLTGESLPSDKHVAATHDGTPLAERAGEVFMSTSVARGTGLAEVTATGMATELGRIAHLLGTTGETRTPLEIQLARLGRFLAAACGALVVVLLAIGALRGDPLLDVLLAAIALGVAAVPEGLPAIVTVALAVGVQRLARAHVLVRRLASVETLGCTTVVCTDKTGTLTSGTMSVRELWGADHHDLVFAAAACCDADLDGPGGGVGDPTEVALLREAASRGIHRRDIERERPRVEVQPFDAATKLMAVRRSDGVTYVKGAIESVLPRCAAVPPDARRAADDMSGRGLRVLAVAAGPSLDGGGLRLAGLVGLADPPRPEAVEAIARARRAGIRTVMITGDHPRTALAIARELGVVADGEDHAHLVHARATPEDKLRIVRAWKERGDVVAMTGDGVNDAPALKEAHVGIAMGRTGTEVTREAADLVLADDNFASIVAGIREGRGVHDNIRKTLTYLLTGNAGELLVMLGAVSLGLPLPLLPLQILWINLVTDGLPALALVMEPTEADVLERAPRAATEPVLRRRELAWVLGWGAVDAAVTLGAFAWALREGSVSQARDVAFMTLVFIELFRAFGSRSATRVFWELGPFTNLRLLAVVALSAGLQLAIHHLELTREIFGLEAVSLRTCLLAGLVALVPVTLLEVSKLVRRGARRGSAARA